jgi:hypothetical protein
MEGHVPAVPNQRLQETWWWSIGHGIRMGTPMALPEGEKKLSWQQLRNSLLLSFPPLMGIAGQLNRVRE